MEIAHTRQTGIFRMIAKFVLLGLLVLVLAKVLLTLLALFVLGLALYVCARAIYTRRSWWRQMLFSVRSGLIEQAGAAVRVTRALGTALTAELVRLFVILAATARTCTLFACRCATHGFCGAAKIVAVVPLVAIRGGIRAARVLRVAVAETCDRSQLIFATIVEAASGAIVGAMLGLLPSFLAHEDPVQARICGAALFGAFLGVTVSLSRTSWVKEDDSKEFIR